MKRILITGAGSYIGTSFASYLSRFPDTYEVDTLGLRGNAWKETSFAGYDAVYHVAGIAHVDGGKKGDEALYRAVNTDLAVATAAKAKADGVRQFIFMSSVLVYGKSTPSAKHRVIGKETVPHPVNFYGRSKLQAEEGILPLEDDNFRIAILRCPMVYGEGCRGNYSTLSRYAVRLPFFPRVGNRRSMLYIENLSSFVRQVIDAEASGIFHPQNAEYVNTSECVALIAACHGKKVRLTRAFNWALFLLRPFTGLVDKVFGDVAIDMEMSRFGDNSYQKVTFEESIRRVETAGSL